MEEIKKILAESEIKFAKKINSAEKIKICPVCKEPIQADMKYLDSSVIRMPIPCKCKRKENEENRKKEKEEEQKKIKRYLEKFSIYSSMNKEYNISTFDNWEITEENKKAYNLGKRYCEQWEKMKKNNTGLLIHGDAGIGKSYLAFSIANELYKNNISTLAISISRLLTVIKESYSASDKEGELYILDLLRQVELLILDDVGVENMTKWSYEKIYNIIDGRNQVKKPLIITTNLTIEGLREYFKVMDYKTESYDPKERIYNRIFEMCSPTKLTGESFRIKKGLKKQKLLFSKLEQ